MEAAMEESKEKWAAYGCAVCGRQEAVKQCDTCHKWACDCNRWACAVHITSLSTGDICGKCAGVKKS